MFSYIYFTFSLSFPGFQIKVSDNGSGSALRLQYPHDR